jgi:hypothetical protein
MLLEISQYLENYLWPHFDAATASFEHVMSMVMMINEKFREGVPGWTCFHTNEVSRRAAGRQQGQARQRPAASSMAPRGGPALAESSGGRQQAVCSCALST